MPHSNNLGFTLIECLTVIAVSSVLIIGITSNWNGLTARSERSAALNELTAAFNLARISAVNRGHTVTLCPLDSDNECSKDWGLPIAIFSDRQNIRRLENPQNLIRELPAPAMGYFVPQPANKRYFQFRQDGMVRGTLGNVTYCPRNNQAKNAGRLIINMGGRLRQAKDGDGDGIVDGSDGKSIAC